MLRSTGRDNPDPASDLRAAPEEQKAEYMLNRVPSAAEDKPGDACACCGNHIQTSADLFVVAYWGLLLSPMCRQCFADRSKTYDHHWRGGGVPINSNATTVSLTFSLFALVMISVVAAGSTVSGSLAFFWLLHLWGVVLRGMSFLRFERKVWSSI